MPIYRLLEYLYKTPAWIRVVLAFTWYAFIWTLTELPQATAGHTKQAIVEAGGAPVLDWYFRVSSHMFVFGVQALLIYSAINPLLQYKKKGFVVTLVLISLLGTIDEIHQSFVPDRFPRWEDVFKDLLGAILCLGLLFILRSKVESFWEKGETLH